MDADRTHLVERLRGGLIASSQAMDPRSPLREPRTLTLLALAAELGGADGFRVDGPAVVELLRARTSLPIIGIVKRVEEGSEVYITRSAKDAAELIDAGADIIAADATVRERGNGETFADIVGHCGQRGIPVMADVSTVEEGRAAAAVGASLVATTLAGHTADTQDLARPALDLTRSLVAELAVPVVVEGGIWTTDHVRQAFAAGATAIVVGAAVSAPDYIVRRLRGAIAASD
jgi:N-acylglucosamine-6-phosphate 2-epimerase